MNNPTKIAFITGISRGIGKALAEKFLSEGYAVIGTSQTGAKDFNHENLNVFQLDLTSTDSIKNCVENISKQLKESDTKIDILINNAGTLEDEEDTHVIVQKLRDTLEVNLIGTIDFTEQSLSLLRGNGHIVNLSSQAGSIGDMDNIEDSHEPYHYPAYKISKAALNMYTRTLAVRLKHENTGTLVSAIHPGWVRTDMGGNEAPMAPEEAAEWIFKLSISKPETGQFWFKGEKYEW